MVAFPVISYYMGFGFWFSYVGRFSEHLLHKSLAYLYPSKITENPWVSLYLPALCVAPLLLGYEAALNFLQGHQHLRTRVPQDKQKYGYIPRPMGHFSRR